MELTFGTAQVYTSEKMKKAPVLAKLFKKIKWTEKKKRNREKW